MIVKSLWGVRKGYERAAPELMAAWDEYTIDENPEGWTEACEKAIASWGDDLLSWRIIDIQLPVNILKQQFEPAEIAAVIV